MISLWVAERFEGREHHVESRGGRVGWLGDWPSVVTQSDGQPGFGQRRSGFDQPTARDLEGSVQFRRAASGEAKECERGGLGIGGKIDIQDVGIAAVPSAVAAAAAQALVLALADAAG